MAASNLNIPEAPEIDGARHLHSGKVRDLYELPDGNLLMVASDRISAFDFVLETPIPDKGEILTRMSLWWFDQLEGLVQNHVVSTDVPGRRSAAGRWSASRWRCTPSSAWRAATSPARRSVDYRTYGEVCGIALPAGLQDGSRLPEPIFTPATKAALGDHDENVDYESVAEQVGDDAAAELRMLTLAVYGKAEAIARERGHHPGRHEVRVRPPLRLDDRARRRGADARLLALLAGRGVAAGPHPAVVRQADRAQLAALARVGLGPRVRRGRRRRCRRRSSSARGPGTSRPTSCSPASPGDQRNVTRGGYDMSSFTITLDLPQPPAALFRYLADPRNRPEWQSSLRPWPTSTPASRTRACTGATSPRSASSRTCS